MEAKPEAEASPNPKPMELMLFAALAALKLNSTMGSAAHGTDALALFGLSSDIELMSCIRFNQMIVQRMPVAVH